jgi:Uma2 family endonuclease
MSAASKKTPAEDRPTFDPRDDRFNREVIRGHEMMSPRPARPHTYTATQLTTEINYRYRGPKGGGRGPGGWLILHEPELHLENEDPVIPDLAGWRRERAPRTTSEAAYVTAPDWICEVLSPGTKDWDREEKMPFYAFHRVGHLWLVDPIARLLEAYALGRRGWELLGTFGGSKTVRAEPFDDMDFSLDLIWPEEPVEPPSKISR